MFTLGVRLWTGKDMAYPSRFSILIDFDTRVSSMRTYIDNVRIDSKTYMMLTPGVAVNGEIYESDIICSCEDENLVGVVEFDSSLGAFVAYIDNNPVYITSEMGRYEIVGNIFEDWDEFGPVIKNREKFDKIIEDTRLQNEENERVAQAKAKKEEEKRLREEQAKALEEAKESVVEEKVENEEEPQQEEVKEEVKTVEETVKNEQVENNSGETVNNDSKQQNEGPSEKEIFEEEQLKKQEELTASLDEEFDEQKDLPSKMTISTEERRQRELEKDKALEDDFNNFEGEIPDRIMLEEHPKKKSKKPLYEQAKPDESSNNEPVKQEQEELPIIEEELPEIEENTVPDNLNPDEFQMSEISDFDMFPDVNTMEDPVEPDFEFEDEEPLDIKLYVDGQGKKENSDGAFSYILQYDNNERVNKQFCKSTTKQRMELTAVITALHDLTTRCNIKIYTTSQYLVVPFLKGWITRWRANNWKKESNEEVKNKDLWEELYLLYAEQNIEWEFIKPGSSIVEILRCIDLSKEALAKKK